MNTFETARLLAIKTGTKIAERKDGILRDIRTGVVIPDEHLVHPPADDGMYIMYEYTCDGTCSIGSKGHKKDGGICSVYTDNECGTYRTTKIYDDTVFIMSFKDFKEIT
jgi:hypothetical protein